MTLDEPDPRDLLFDGIRILIQILVEVQDARLPAAMHRDIQDWYDRCERLVENKSRPIADEE